MEHVQDQTICFGYDRIELKIHQSSENDWLYVILACRLINALNGIMGFIELSTKGMRMCLKLASNCAKIDWLKFSAVMPVPSETIKTMRDSVDISLV